MPGWARKIAAWPIRVYQVTLSWLLGGRCRFEPSCSRYGLEAIAQHGALKGWLMALRRVSRCHPLNPGGFDPVPPANSQSCCTRHEQAQLQVQGEGTFSPQLTMKEQA